VAVDPEPEPNNPPPPVEPVGPDEKRSVDAPTAAEARVDDEPIPPDDIDVTATDVDTDPRSKRRKRKTPKRSASTPKATPAKLKVIVSPWGKVYLDGKEMGTTPSLRILEAPPGRHTIRAVHPELGELKKTVVFGKQTSVTLEFPRP
jgi:hypothetical protein